MQALEKYVMENARDSEGRRLYQPKIPPVDVGSLMPGTVFRRRWLTPDGGVCGETTENKRKKNCFVDPEEVCVLFPNADTKSGSETWVQSANSVKFTKASFNAIVPVLSGVIGAEFGSNNTVGYSAKIGGVSTHEVSTSQPYTRSREECRAAKDRVCLANFEGSDRSFDGCKAKLEKIKAKLPEDQWDNIFLIRKVVVTEDFTVEFERNPQIKPNPNAPTRADNVQQPPTSFSAESDFIRKIVAGVTNDYAAKGLLKSPLSVDGGEAVGDLLPTEPTGAGDSARGENGGSTKITCGSGFSVRTGASLAELGFGRQACVVSDGVIRIRDPRVIAYVPVGLTTLVNSGAFENRPGERRIETKEIDLEWFSAAPGIEMTDEIAAILTEEQ
jgi:hypothetical protein